MVLLALIKKAPEGAFFIYSKKINLYLEVLLFENNSFNTFITLEINQIYSELFNYTSYNGNIYIINPQTLEKFLSFENDSSNFLSL